MKDLEKFVIDRKVWARGGMPSSLLNLQADEPRTQCCVGLYCTALGVPDEVIRGQGVADALSLPAPKVPTWLTTGPGLGWVRGADVQDLYTTNDDFALAENVREGRITEVFARHGVAVEFTG